MNRRPLGDTGEELSIIGMGGIVVSGLEQSQANRIVRFAFDKGVNYFDVAPTYADAEDRLGPALEGIRDRVFLACKTNQRQAADARRELHESLGKLRTDRFDLYQLHGLSSVEEVEQCFAPGGAMEVLLEAREQGQIRYLGFSAHSPEAALEAMERFDFTSVLFPFNYITYYKGGFGPAVLERAQEKGVARLALKAMARRPWPEGAPRKYSRCWYEPFDDEFQAEMALRWTLSLPITAAIPPGEPELFERAIRYAERFRPLNPDEQAMVENRIGENEPIFSAAA